MRNNMDQTEYQKILDDTNRAIKQGWDNAQVEWRIMVMKVIYQLALDNQEISSNDVMEIIKDSPVKTHDLRAMGGAVKSAAKYKWIEKTDRVVRNTTHLRSRATHLGQVVAVWRSLIYKPKAGQGSLL